MSTLSRYAVYAFLFLVPVFLVGRTELGGHDAARLAQCFLFTVCALSALWAPSPIYDGAHRARWVRWMILLVLVLGVTSALRADAPMMAVRELALASGALTMALSLGVRDTDRSQFTMVTIVSMAVYASVVSILVGTAYLAGLPLIRAELFVGYDNYRFFNHVQTVTLPLLGLAASTANPSRAWRGMGWFALVAGFALAIATGARGTLLGVGVGLAVALAFLGGKAWPAARNTLIGAVAGAAIFGIVFMLLPVLIGVPKDADALYISSRESSIEARYYLWRIALVSILKEPLLGIGPMHYSHWQNYKAAHPHNVYLQLAAEWGFPVLFVVLVLAGRGLWKLGHKIIASQGMPALEGSALFIALVALLTDAAFSGNFVMPVSQVWIAFVCGWALSWYRQGGNGDGFNSRDRWVAFAAVSALVLLSITWWEVLPEVSDFEEYLQQRATEMQPGVRPSPRFWSNGWF